MRQARTIAWSIWTVSVVGTLGLVAFILATQQVGPMGSPLADSAYVLALLSFPTVGALIASRRPRNPIGWLLCLTGPIAIVLLGGPAYAQWALTKTPGSWIALFSEWLALVSYLPAFALFAFVLLLFPDGRLPSRRWFAVAALLAGTAILGAVGYALSPALRVEGVGVVPNPFAIGVDLSAYAAAAGDLLFTTVALPLAAISLIVRAARARGTERQQLKWLAYAAAVAVSGLVFGGFYYGSQLGFLVSGLAALAFPLAIGIAILRYRLFDIDLLINRTVVYGATSTAIAVLFWVGIVALQLALRGLTAANEFAIAGSALVSFALFQPVRRRIQDAVDRRFDRSRYDAARTLDAFADRLRDEVDLDELRSDLIDAVRRTMGPTQTSLWLRRHS
jgi:hypothetical protein